MRSRTLTAWAQAATPESCASYTKNATVQTLARLLYARKRQYQVHANMAGPMERTAVLIAHARTRALVEQPLNIAAMLATSLRAVQEHHIGAQRARIGRALKMLVHVIMEVVNVALDDLVKFIASMTPLSSSIYS